MHKGKLEQGKRFFFFQQFLFDFNLAFKTEKLKIKTKKTNVQL
jgi:hypothetical protein